MMVSFMFGLRFPGQTSFTRDAYKYCVWNFPRIEAWVYARYLVKETEATEPILRF